MADNARGIHVSPGIYTREIDINYAVRSLGITTLGVAGETLKGPAFQPMDIANWREFQEVFGGTSTEKFKGSQYPKYELPYIAKSYLSESEQLKVVRVLGLSGYNAGPAWVITANNQVVAVLRSRGTYRAYETGLTEVCTCEPSKYDALKYYVGEPLPDTEDVDCARKKYNLNALQIGEYIPISSDGDECEGYTLASTTGSFSISQYNHGRFKIFGVKGSHKNSDIAEIYRAAGVWTPKPTDETHNYEWAVKQGYFEYPVTLNPYDKEYILNVLGTKPYDGDAYVFVESLYDVALDQGIAEGRLTMIDSGQTSEEGSTDITGKGLKGYQVYQTADYDHHEPVGGIITVPQNSLRRKNVGMRFLATELAEKADKDRNNNEGLGISTVPYDYSTGKPLSIYDVFYDTIITTKDSESGDTGTWFTSYGDGTIHAEYMDVINTDTWVENKLYTKWGSNEQYKDSASAKAALLERIKATPVEVYAMAGQIYTVRQYTTADGKRHYYYAFYVPSSVDEIVDKYKSEGKTIDPTNMYGNLLNGGTKGIETKLSKYTAAELVKLGANSSFATIVLNTSNNLYYKMVVDEDRTTTAKTEYKVGIVEVDFNDYKSQFRFASTPWIVSNLKGDYNHVEINKLFRFHTITDGNNANYEVKISIENIRPDEGTFDVVVRRIDDGDEQIIPLEKFGRCTMRPGDSSYIAYKIGTFDGVYESKSKYITVEVNDSTATRMSVPAGFLGYPVPQFNGEPISGEAYDDIITPRLQYNRFFNPDIKNRKQYFGLSSWVGVDIDNFTFKGNKAYIEDPDFMTNGFHLDSRLDTEYGGLASDNVSVDGEYGYKFDCVSTNSRTSILTEPPVIGTEDEMFGSIYEYVNLRKFTVYFYGGFDGWDDYRDQRTNTDEYKMSQYRGYINQGSGEGYAFNRIKDPDLLQLNQNGITSDWYAYLSGIRQFSNPEATDINVFATPGIDYVNNKLLVEEAIEMIEEERADSIYVVTTPDKPSGAGDYVDEMYTPDDAVGNLEDTEIDSNYTCTYYPWVKYLDQDNNQYIYLPATKDAVRNFAQTDNTAYPWFAPAGIERGNVDCVRAHFITKIGDEDILYDGRINPIKTFAQDGPKIWGQKNLQINESQLNRIAVRRLLLRMRKLIAISCIGLIFEPNDPTVKQSFLSTVTPIMDSIRSNRGISDYRIEINDTIESRERRELPVKIFFKPYNALEYIVIDFILTPEGVSFDDI